MKHAWLAGSIIVSALFVFSEPRWDLLDMELEAHHVAIFLSGDNPYETEMVARPPIALVLFGFLPYINVDLFAKTMTMAAVVIMSLLAVRISGAKLYWLPVIATAAAVSIPTRFLAGVGNSSSVIIALVGVAWLIRSPVLVGIAVAIKLYPIVWAFPVGWKRAFTSAVALTVVGFLFLPDPVGMIADLLDTTAMAETLPGTASPIAIITRNGGSWWWILPILASGAGLALWSARVPYHQGMSIASVLTLLVPSIVWPGYHLVLVPCIAWAVSRGRWWALLAVPLLVFETATGVYGWRHMLAALIVLSAVV